MTIKYLLVTVFFLFCSLEAQEKEKITFTTITGTKYENVKVSKVLPHVIYVTSSKGVFRISMDQLPKEMQEKFGYDPQKAAASGKQAQINQAAARARMAAKRAKITKAATISPPSASTPIKILTAKHIKNYWVNTFPRPKSLDPYYHAKKRAYTQLVVEIKDGKLDNLALEKAYTWNLKEHLRVGDHASANQVRKDLAALNTKVHQEKLRAIEREKVAAIKENQAAADNASSAIWHMKRELDRMSADMRMQGLIR